MYFPMHGTMVSGIIASKGTVTGVAPNASLLAYKVSDATDNALMTDTIAERLRVESPPVSDRLQFLEALLDAEYRRQSRSLAKPG